MKKRINESNRLVVLTQLKFSKHKLITIVLILNMIIFDEYLKRLKVTNI